MQGKIIKGVGGFYTVHNGIGTAAVCRARGVFRDRGEKPLVGDNVEFSLTGEPDGSGRIEKLLPRKNELIRPAVANMDQALILVSAGKPAFHPLLLDNFLLWMGMQDVPVVIGIGKCDTDPEEAKRIAAVYAGTGFPVLIFSALSGEGLEAVAGHDELAMNLVADDLDAVTQADVVHPLQFVARPDAARRVVGVAEQEEGGLRVGALGFEIGPVDFEAVVAGKPQHTFKRLAAVVADGGEEAVVVGREDEHPFARHRERLDGYRHGGDDTCGIENLFATDGPLVAALEPGDDSVVVVVADDGVAEDAVLSPFANSLLYGRCRTEVHVGHPQRDDIP